jgi:peroxiredoxin
VKHAADEPLEQYWEKELAFGRTPEGKVYKEWRFGQEFAVKPDGSFRIDELPPGKYTISVRCFETDSEVNFSEDIAKAEMAFEIPPASATQPLASVPIEIGTATPTAVARMRPGAAAPDFTVTTIDGQVWKYADHRGKPLVLVFWGTYSNTDRIKAYGDFARKWGKDPRLSILGCFNARAVPEARKAIAENNLEFPHTDDLSLMSKFDSSWPEAVVVSADGKIMQKHLHDKVLEKYVKKALGISPSSSSSGANAPLAETQSKR